MIVSRIVPMAIRSSGTFKSALSSHQAFQNQHRLISTTVARQGGGGGWHYRSMPVAERKWQIWADVAGAFMWWWIFWHLMTDYHHIIGHYPFPDIDAWTDEELGIPPDDADDP